jgi:hypothetical protein
MQPETQSSYSSNLTSDGGVGAETGLACACTMVELLEANRFLYDGERDGNASDSPPTGALLMAPGETKAAAGTCDALGVVADDLLPDSEGRRPKPPRAIVARGFKGDCRSNCRCFLSSLEQSRKYFENLADPSA